MGFFNWENNSSGRSGFDLSLAYPESTLGLFFILSALQIILAGADFGFYAYQKANPSEPEHTGFSRITKEQAVENVKNLPEVRQYLKDVPNGRVEQFAQ